MILNFSPEDFEEKAYQGKREEPGAYILKYGDLDPLPDYFAGQGIYLATSLCGEEFKHWSIHASVTVLTEEFSGEVEGNGGKGATVTHDSHFIFSGGGLRQNSMIPTSGLCSKIYVSRIS